METFICEDCKKTLPLSKIAYGVDICKNCLEEYEDRTGYCSDWCRVNNQCDDSC